MKFGFVFPKGEVFATWKQNVFSIFSFCNCTVSILNSSSFWFKGKHTKTDCCVKLTGMSVNLAVRDIGCRKISNGNSFLFWRLKIMDLGGSYLHGQLGGFPRSLSGELWDPRWRLDERGASAGQWPVRCPVITCHCPRRWQTRKQNSLAAPGVAGGWGVCVGGASGWERASKVKPHLFWSSWCPAD